MDSTGELTVRSGSPSGAATATAAEVVVVNRRVSELKQAVARIDETLKRQAEATRQVSEEVKASHEDLLAKLTQLIGDARLGA